MITCHVIFSCVELTGVTVTPVGFPGAGCIKIEEQGEKEGRKGRDTLMIITSNNDPHHSRRGQVTTVMEVGLLEPTELIATTEMV